MKRIFSVNLDENTVRLFDATLGYQSRSSKIEELLISAIVKWNDEISENPDFVEVDQKLKPGEPKYFELYKPVE